MIYKYNSNENNNGNFIVFYREIGILKLYNMCLALKGAQLEMGKPIFEKDDQVNFLKHRLTMFLEVLDNLNPEEADLEDVDRLLEILDELEVKCEQFKTR